MNIGLCYENVDPTRGGCETYIADLARRLVETGHDVSLYASRWNAGALVSGLNIVPVPRPGGPRFLRPWKFGRSVLEQMSTRRHDITLGFDKTWGQDVHYPQGGVFSASLQANIRKHALPIMRTLARIAKSIDPAVYSFSQIEKVQCSERIDSSWIVNSEMVKQHAQQLLGMPPTRIHVVHAAIRAERMFARDRQFIRRRVRSDWGIDENVPAALFVAMNYQLKGLEPLLHSLRYIPPTPLRLVVVGNANFRAYRRLAHRLGVEHRVTFHGFCDDARQVYFASDFLVHPTFYDPCSLVALEALAVGLPVITSRFNGASELMNPPNDGLIINDPHDHCELAGALQLLADTEFRIHASKKALESASRWTFDDHCRKMMAILETVANKKNSTRPRPVAA